MKTIFAALAFLPALVSAQATPTVVSLDARGTDVREVLATLFAQVHKPYALAAEIKGPMYIVIDRMPFAKALSIVTSQAHLKAVEKDGVLMVTTTAAPTPATVKAVSPKPTAPKQPEAKPFDPTVLKHRVNTKLAKKPLAEVFDALGSQAKVTIEIDSEVPAYRVDAFLKNTSLKYALDQICRAAKLTYAPTPAGTILIKKA